MLGIVTIAGATAASAQSHTGTSATPQSSAPTQQPMVTIGGPNANAETTRVTAGPVTEGLRLSLTPASIRGYLGHPIVVSLWLNSIGDRNRLVCFGSFRNELRITATDGNGTRLVQVKPEGIVGSVINGNRCGLETNAQWRYLVPINEFVRIAAPGRYMVTAALSVQTNYPAVHNITLQSNTIQLTVAP